MATLVQLPDGNTALFRDGNELTNRQMKDLRRAARKVGALQQRLKELGFDAGELADAEEDARNEKAVEVLSHLSDDEDDALDLFQRSCVIARLKEWTLPEPMPTTPEEVDDLTRPVYAALTSEAIKINLNEEFGLEGAKDPKADTDD